MGEPAIAVRGLRKSFGAKEAAAGIDLETAAGSFAGLVGPKGAAVARLLVQLKLRLLRNALRSSTTARVSFIVSTSFAVPAGT